MRFRVVFLGLLVLTSGSLLGGSPSSEPFVWDISCPSSTGCQRLIGRAVELAPRGAILRIAPGLYYEYPFTIERSLVLEGSGPEATKILLLVPRTEGPQTEPSAAITILGNQGISVELKGFRLEAPLNVPLDFVFSGNRGVKILSQTTEEMQVTLKDVYIQSMVGILAEAAQFGGLLAQGPALSVETSTIVAFLGIHMEGGHLTLTDSHVLATETPLLVERLRTGINLTPGLSLPPSGPSIILSYSVQAVLDGNQIQGFDVGIIASARSLLSSSLSAQLLENDISTNQVGMMLSGDQVNVSLVKNQIHGNTKYGIMLVLPGCGSTNTPDFKGTVQGTENRVYDNQQGDLCPTDYPWPPGFTKP